MALHTRGKQKDGKYYACRFLYLFFLYFCIDKSTKNARSFSPTTSVSAKAAEAIVSQRLLSFCVISSATNKHPLSSAFGGHAVMLRTKPKLSVSHNYHLALCQMRGDKPPRRKRGNQRNEEAVKPAFEGKC